MAYLLKKSYKTHARKASATGELVTFEKFYEAVEESRQADLLDGRIIRDSSPTPKHARIVRWLTTILTFFTERFDLGEVFPAPMAVKLSAYQTPEPDLFFISKKRQKLVDDRYADGAPDICIEIISKTSRKRDRDRKFVLYTDHGLQEYWMIDSIFDTGKFYENQAGEWVAIQPDEQRRLRSKILPGFWLKPEWLKAEPLPPVLQALQEILGKEIVLS